METKIPAEWPIYRYPDNSPSEPHVYVGRCRSQHERGGYGLGAQTVGVLVFALGRTGELFRTVVQADRRWDPAARNNLDTDGAFRAVPPDAAAIETAIRQAKGALTTESRALDGLPLPEGWGAPHALDGWTYSPPNKPGAKPRVQCEYCPDGEPLGLVSGFGSYGNTWHAHGQYEEWLGRFDTPESAMRAVEDHAKLYRCRTVQKTP